MTDSKNRGLVFVLAFLIGGCASTKNGKFGGTADSKMVAVVGDHPMPSTVGEPGGQVSASEVEPEPRRSSVARISGRVLDEQGQAVPDATVRLADGGVKGGRDIQATTDASGAFTLGGLRAGSTYTLLAESDDGRTLMTGRKRAKTSETGIEITLQAKDDGTTATHSPAKASRVRPIPSRADEESTLGDRPGINREDVGLPGEDPGASLPGKPRMSAPEPAVGWRNPAGAASRSARNVDEDVESVATSGRPRRTKPTTSPDEEDEVDPLPAAKEPDVEETAPAKPRRKVSARPAPDDPREVAAAPQSRRPSNPRPSAPEPMPNFGPDDPSIGSPLPEALPADPQASLLATAAPPGGLPLIPETPSVAESPPPFTASTQTEAPTLPAPQPVFASGAPAKNPEPDAPYNPFALVAASEPAPTVAVAIPRQVAAAPAPRPRPVEPSPEPVPAPEAPIEPAPSPSASPKKTWGELSTGQAKPPTTKPTKATAFLARFKQPGAADGKTEVVVPSVAYDANAHRLTDFTLPDLQGKPVRFQDFEADYILLDFWGTQYKPCLDSIPHLVGLQKQYGPTRLKVVGIACEKGTSKPQRAQVDEFTRKLGINYAVLLSDITTACPVRQALDIRYYPTMILVDRNGQVVWSGEGATPANLYKLDLFLSKKLPSATARR